MRWDDGNDGNERVELFFWTQGGKKGRGWDKDEGEAREETREYLGADGRVDGERGKERGRQGPPGP